MQHVVTKTALRIARLVAVVLTALAASGCELEYDPGSYSVDPACPAPQAEVIHDVVATYCDELPGTCMGLRPYPDAELNINCSNSYDAKGYGSKSAAHAGWDLRHGVDGDYFIDLRADDARETWTDLGLFWRVVAHELGHVFGLDHAAEADTIMAAALTYGPAELDHTVTEPLSRK